MMNAERIEMHGQLESTTLVFPATHPDGLKYLEEAREHDENVVAATSECGVELQGWFGELIVLPYVHETAFQHCFLDLVNRHNINRVYAPVAAVYSWLSKFITERKLELVLVGESPIKREMERFNRQIDKVASYRCFIDECAGGVSDLTDLEIASVFRTANHIYGESNEQKIAAMMAIFYSAPKGDVVEVGSLVGKSASVLALLARRYQTGNVLAVDPWQSDAATQYDSPETVRVDMVGEWEYEMLPQDFIINLLPIGLSSFNYLRQKSAKGFEIFRDSRTVTSYAFGTVNYLGRIAVIHIDGNHDYAEVKQDCELWLSLLVEDGWLILDDYLWAHGDGPHRVGNELLERRWADIERTFVCGKALFIKFGGV